MGMSQTVKISDDLHAALKSRSSLEQRTIATVLQRAFDYYVTAFPNPIEPRSLRAELEEAIQPERYTP